LQKGKQSAIIY